MTAISSGTARSRRWQASRTCWPRMSLQAMRPTGTGSEASQRAICPCSRSQLCWRRAGPGGFPDLAGVPALGEAADEALAAGDGEGLVGEAAEGEMARIRVRAGGRRRATPMARWSDSMRGAPSGGQQSFRSTSGNPGAVEASRPAAGVVLRQMTPSPRHLPAARVAGRSRVRAVRGRRTSSGWERR